MNLRLWTSTSVLALAIASSAHGPSWAAAAADGQSATQVEEVVVTARKREERLQDIPIAITAFTRADMERAGVTSLVDVAQRTPGLQYGDFGDLKLSPTSLRGIVGSAGSAGADPAVGYYVDEVYEGQGPGANLDLYDIDRVEVLRGPQGTLFGRNTIGGVINITTQRPTDEFHASMTADFGSYNRQRVGVSVSGPIVAGLIDAKISTVRDVRDGYDLNTFLDRRVNNSNSWSTRGQLLFKFAPETELLLTGEYRTADQEPLVFETLKYNMTQIVPQLLVAGGYPLNTDPFDRNVISGIENREYLSSSTFAATFKTRLGGVGVTNIASYHRHSYYDRVDTCRCQISVSYDGDPEKVWRASDELRFDGKIGRVSWLAGGYYFHQNSDNESFVELGQLFGIFFDPSLVGLKIGSQGELKTTSEALFGSGTWSVDDRLDVTFGGRWTRDHKTIHYSQFDPLFLLGGTATIDAKDSWSQFTPNANIRYRFSPGVVAYVSASKGFKSGGFNDALGDADGIAFGPETLWNYEAGVKMELLDRRLILNADAYYMKWNRIQITAQNPATTFFDPIILNAGAAHSEGVEVELQARPTEHLWIGANASVQRARYDEGALPTGQPLDRIPYAPDYTGALSANYAVPLDGWGHVDLFAEYLVHGGMYLTTNNDPDGHVSPYGLINLRLSLQPNDSRWRVSLYGKNLADEVHRQRLFDLFDNPFNGQKFIVLSEPRTVGLELRVDY